MPEPVIVSETDMSLVKWLGGIAMSALGGLLLLVYNKHEKDFDKLQVRVDKVEESMVTRADCRESHLDVERRFDRGSDKFDELLAEIRTMRQEVGQLHAHLVGELAARPTRAEVQQMLQQQSRGL